VTGVLTVLPVPGIPEVRPGDDLAALVLAAAELRDGDVVVVAQKAVSKAEGAVVRLDPAEDRAAARRRLAVQQSVRVLVDAPWTVVVETRHGLVCANAGIDASNVEPGVVTLLPDDPDASARGLRAALQARTGLRLAVLVTDTFGRAWRHGQTDVAIGLAGLAAIRDERGTRDRSGIVLEVTEAAVADELAAAADLVRDKAAGVPVVIVRGYAWAPDDAASAADLVRPTAQDLFARGRGALADVLAAPVPPPPLAPRVPTAGDRRRVVAAARTGGEGRVEVGEDDGPQGWAVTLRAPSAAPDDLVALGAAVATARAALYDLGLAPAPRPTDDPLRRVVGARS